MVSFPAIQIRQQYAKIGIDANIGKLEQEQPKAAMEISTTPSKLDIVSPPGELVIDQSRAWDALGIGNHLETMSRIYDKAQSVFLEGIARIVENGNKLAAIHENTNAIADIAEQSVYNFPEYDFFGEPSFDNVDIQYTVHKPIINVIDGSVNIRVEPHKPELKYIRGKLNIYMQQYSSVQIIPPQIDMKM